MSERTQTVGCTCPRCSAPGRSVAAMNYAETQVWDKSGTFSGSGIGIGTGGVGIGFGGGSYSEHGQISTKRAVTFEEPAPFNVPILPIVFSVVFALAAIQFAPAMFDMFGMTDGSTSFDNVSSVLLTAIKWLGAIAAIAAVPYLVYRVLRAGDEEAHLNSKVYPQRLARYQELLYCADCHTLYDAHGNTADANGLGFDSMMQIGTERVAVAALQ
ncbi:hypothetical protein [Burkholderia sp. Ac-20365]|uniref:hypothetical protein n=1 Tax=Burkholderia sp. Ac-20365 TaxID=2703897 RepID=UPI00197BD612|nr:hypothetical protein [Burkholderia sp. Ac-20365]MBN3761271.1 hypothetical protein [Burkholderia sp. Ac-20365]